MMWLPDEFKPNGQDKAKQTRDKTRGKTAIAEAALLNGRAVF